MQTTTLIQTISDRDYDPVVFNENLNSRIKIKPMYFELGFSSCPKIYGRRSVLTRLINALDLLPPELGFLVWDVYRPRAVQDKLFSWMRNEIQKRSPELNNQQNYDEAKKYMSPPSKVGEEYCPPHLSGGAIDLTLFNIENGKEIEMGTLFDDCTEKAHSNYFDIKECLTNDEKNIREKRILLRNTMNNVGFVSYQYEWWHFDMGDIFWSRITGHPAIFGPLFGDDEWPGAEDLLL